MLRLMRFELPKGIGAHGSKLIQLDKSDSQAYIKGQVPSIRFPLSPIKS